jgi:hypothetical protein
MRLLAALVLPAVIWIPDAAADGETSPLFGAAVFGTTTSQASDSAAGVELEAVSWHGRIGLAFEASARTAVDGSGSRPIALGGSVRLRLMQTLVPSLLEPSDVELGIELQAIVEQTLWNGELTGHEPTHQGIGLALRLRSSTDEDMPRLITESRFFIRVMSWQAQDAELARAMQPILPADREVMVLVGIGAAFGGGDAMYLRQFAAR